LAAEFPLKSAAQTLCPAPHLQIPAAFAAPPLLKGVHSMLRMESQEAPHVGPHHDLPIPAAVAAPLTKRAVPRDRARRG
jgi:hypothetical protein